MPTHTIPADPRVPDPHPIHRESPDEAWTLARRLAGYGDVYLPVFKKVIKEGEMWYLPAKELADRPDWEEVQSQEKPIQE